MRQNLKNLNDDIERCYINCCYTGDNLLKVYLEFALDRLQVLLKREGETAKKRIAQTQSINVARLTCL